MNLDEFRATLSDAKPPAVAPLLRAMWYAANGKWDEAHGIAQEINDRYGAWVHAHLHRVEGDLGNARYWYRHAPRRGHGQHPGGVGADCDRVAAILVIQN